MTAPVCFDALDLPGLSAFAQDNPDRALLLVLPASPSPVLPPDEVDPLPLEPAPARRTLLYGEALCEEAGDLRVALLVPRPLRLRALIFLGSTPDDVLQIRGVFIGDQPVFLHHDGVPLSRFEHPQLADVVEGWVAPAGLPVTISAVASGPARLVVSLCAEWALETDPWSFQ